MERYIIMERWIAFFFVYCFLGWCFESTYVSIKEHRPTNRGFMRGPFLPIYGFGAITILLSTILVTWSIPLIFICGMIGCTLLEYITGAAMENMFSMRYWDYSNQRFNIKGYICLSSSLAWGFFSVLLVKVIHVPVAEFIDDMDKRLLGVLILIVGACMTADFVVSFQKAISFRKLLDYQTAVRKELLELSERFSEAKATFNDMASERQREYFAKQEERISALALELDAAKFKAERFSKSILRSFPHATSEKFGDALDEIKKRVLEKKEA
jgi:uncharacterized membrane protein